MALGFVLTLLLVIVFVVACMGVGVYLMMTARRLRPNSGPRCGGCGYNLTGSTTNRCPECGALFIEAGIITESRVQSRARFWIGLLLVLLPMLPIGFSLATALLANRQRAAAARAIAARQQARAISALRSAQNATSASASRPASRPSSSD